MSLVTTKELLDWAAKNNKAVCAFSLSNMEVIQAVTEAANEMECPVILQVSKGSRTYASPAYLHSLVDAACKSVSIPIALHLDHADSFELCKQSIDSGFTSVMIDGSHLPFEENIELTRKVVEYARPLGVTIEGELGELPDIDENTQGVTGNYTDPAKAAEFVKRTGVDSLAVSIGTVHDGFKYNNTPELRFDILKQIHKLIPKTPLVLHGATSISQADVDTVNKCGGEIRPATGVPEEMLKQCITLGVRKINIDFDLRLAFTAAVRKYFFQHPSHFDPRTYLGAARASVRELIKKKLEVFSK